MACRCGHYQHQHRFENYRDGATGEVRQALTACRKCSCPDFDPDKRTFAEMEQDEP